MKATNKPSPREESILRVFSIFNRPLTLKKLSEITGYPEASVSCGLRTLRRFGVASVGKEWNPVSKLFIYSLKVTKTK